MTGLSETGMTIRRLDEIKARLDNGLRLIFGQELSLDPSTPEAQLNGIFAEDIAILYEIAQAVYLGLNPNYSTGNMLDLVSQIRGILRKPSTATVVDVALEGSPNMTVPQGTLFSASGVPDKTFSLTSAVIMDALGDGTGLVACTETGKIVVPANTLKEITTPVSGLSSVNNPNPGVTGTEQETDEEFRLRSNASVALPSRAILDGMQAGIANIFEVETAIVYENTTNVADPLTGTSPKSMRAIVKGGSDKEIADVIFFRKSLGCGMDGLVTVPVDDINGMPHDIRFDRPVLTNIFVSVDVQELALWTPDQIPLIKQAIVNFAAGEHCSFNGYQIGEDVYASQLYTALIEFNAFNVRSILVGIVAPGAGTIADLQHDELAVFDTANITVTSTP